ncbi:MAG: recombination protein RecR [Clostridiales bacterium]|nr:recombination protein RecR [Clostridiales bacterium]
MSELLPPLDRLIQQFRKLPGVGRKSAQRYVFRLLEMSDAEAAELAEAILDAKRSVRHCSVCFGLSQDEVCPVCLDEERDRTTVCVVEDVRTMLTFERVREYRGLYHVLHGAISPMTGVTPDKLKIDELVERVKAADSVIGEVILATNPTVEGETTALYITKLLRSYPNAPKITRIAYGIPVGGELEYADELTLSRALEGRRNSEG